MFPEVPIPLDHKEPYTLLIAVLLSAQSTDVGVNKITPILFKKAEKFGVDLDEFEMVLDAKLYEKTKSDNKTK